LPIPACGATQIHRGIEAKQQELSAHTASFQALLAALQQQLGSLSQQQAVNSGALAAFFGELGQQVAQLAPITAGTQQQGGGGSQLATDGDDAAPALQQQHGGEAEGLDQQGFVAGTQVSEVQHGMEACGLLAAVRRGGWAHWQLHGS
jgi:hypothetical protein